MAKKKKSEFGQGLTYCIGLFLAHSQREIYDEDYAAWFSGASDHLYDLDLSVVKDEPLKQRLDDWRGKVLHWGHGFRAPYPTKKDFIWSIQQAKNFLLKIDAKIIGVNVKKGEWE
jgi:hypothetical protein